MKFINIDKVVQIEVIQMLSYKHNDVKLILENILDEAEFDIIPVGNHNIGRHLVYSVKVDGDNKYIFKIYYISQRRIREIESLKLLKDSEVKVPRIIKYGEHKGNEWLLLEYIEGEIFEKIYISLSIEEQLSLFRQMGEQIGKLHAFMNFNFIGEWDNRYEICKYGEIFINRIENRIDTIIKQDLPDKKLFKKGISILRDNYDTIKAIKESRLMHNDFSGRNILVIAVEGRYKISAIIDFEQCYPENHEMDLANLYLKYFFDNKEFEKVFLEGYKEHMDLNTGFYKRLELYLIYLVIEHCHWSYLKANDYYMENINLLFKLLQNRMEE
jgi:fructosamine-3-kinase